MAANLLVTARPGAGKTTLVRRVVERLVGDGLRVDGFYTEEVREAGERVGFKVVSLDGAEGILAGVRATAGPRVSKYRVQVAEFEAIGVAALHRALKSADVIILDEIGKMELLSSSFRQAVVQALDSPKPLIGTLGRSSDPLVAEVKQRSDVTLLNLTERNRDQLVETVISWVEERLAGS